MTGIALMLTAYFAQSQTVLWVLIALDVAFLLSGLSSFYYGTTLGMPGLMIVVSCSLPLLMVYALTSLGLGCRYLAHRTEQLPLRSLVYGLSLLTVAATGWAVFVLMF